MTAPSRAHGRDLGVLTRMCIAKNRYPDELTARAAGQHYRERYASESLYVYRCPQCAGFHLTRTRHNAQAAAEWDFRAQVS
jgi:hypothetical protein